jgi:hypothetical protein
MWKLLLLLLGRNVVQRQYSTKALLAESLATDRRASSVM